MNEVIQSFSKHRGFEGKGKTSKGYELMIRQLCLHLRNPHIEQIKSSDIIDYFEGMIILGWDRNSLIPRAVALRKFFEFLRLQGYTVLNEELIPIPSKEYKMPRVMTEETYQALLKAIPESNDPRHIRNAALIRMYWDSVSRNSELLSVDIDQLDLDKREVIIQTEKNKGSRPMREIFWTEDTHKYLMRWIEKRSLLYENRPFVDDKALFIGVGSDRYGRRLTKRGTGELVRRLASRAGLPPGTAVNIHAIRHSGCRQIIKNGGSSADVMNIAGHASVQSTTIYTLMVGEDLQERWQKLKA